MIVFSLAQAIRLGYDWLQLGGVDGELGHPGGFWGHGVRWYWVRDLYLFLSKGNISLKLRNSHFANIFQMLWFTSIFNAISEYTQAEQLYNGATGIT